MTRIIQAGNAEFKSDLCAQPLNKGCTTLLVQNVCDETDLQEWANVRPADSRGMCSGAFPIMGEKAADCNYKAKSFKQATSSRDRRVSDILGRPCP